MGQQIIFAQTRAAGKDIVVGYHEAPHADELLGQILIEDFATPAFLTTHTNAEGHILIGIGGGKLDDHTKRKQGEAASSAMLVAQDLNMVTHPAVAALLKYVHAVDSKGGDTAFGLANVIKEMGKRNVPDSEILDWARLAFNAKLHELEPSKDFSLQYVAVLIIAEHGEEIGGRWLMQGLAAKVEQHQDFFIKAKADFEATATVEKITGPRGSLTLVITESDSREISRFARSRHGAGADIVINRRSGGNVSIMVSNQANLDLGDVVATLKMEEQERRGKVHERNWNILRNEGTIDPSWDVWHFANKVNVLNGSHTATQVSPTVIPLETIVKIVKAMLDPKRFHPDFSASCQIGVCAGQKCPWYGLGIRRCLSIRARAHAGSDL